MSRERAQFRCVVCERETSHEDVFEKLGFPIVRCVGCGLNSTLVPEDFDPKSIYDASYFDGTQDDGYVDYVASEALLRQEFRATVWALREHGIERGKVFELGCAYGFFLAEADRYFRVSGAELAPQAVAFCKKRGFDVVPSLDDDELAKRGPFDAWVMLDVVEHLENPDHVLAMASKHVRTGGTILLTTGDAGSPMARALGKRWRLMTPPQHLFFFDAKTITKLLENHGFRVLRIEHPWKKVPLRLAAFQLGRALGIQSFARYVPATLGVPVNLFDAMRVIAERI